MAIEPQRLALVDETGLEAAPVAAAAGPGLRVLIGPNNAGKTRLLRALERASLSAHVKLSEHAKNAQLQHASVDALWPNLELDVSWPRSLEKPPPGYHAGQTPTAIVFSSPRIGNAARHLDGNEEPNIRGHLWPLLARHPAALVPTDRYCDQDVALAGQSITLDAPSSWSALLAQLANSDNAELRQQFNAIDAAVNEITETMRVRARVAQGGLARIQVEEIKGRERPLNACGDGVRDLIGIVLYASYHPEKDLLVDEPGLRLHPHVQRRLLRYLEQQATERAVWIASHDSVFVAAPQVRNRFYVRRDPDGDRSLVTELIGRAQLASAHEELGWIPADAFLADRMLMCEGPSDRTAFEGAVGWLAEEDVRLGGTVVTELGGSGTVWGNRAELIRKVDLVRKIAPYARHSLLIDRDSHTQDEVAALKAVMEEDGVQVAVFPKNELENLWLEPALTHAILVGLAEEATARTGAPVNAPSLEQVAAVLADLMGGTDIDAVKGSEVLGKVCDQFTLRPGKTAPARIAMAHIRDLAPGAAEILKATVRGAISD